ncbi:MAG: hypothetical protein GOV00_01015 [Candidatus Altiarchaeota archaeon]|nr:hypothetical protein [Candidatus Altiarchaeota archaeon]
MEVDLQIGKAGLEKAIEEIKSRLKHKRSLRIKVNKPLIEGRMKEYTRDIAEKVASETCTKLEMVRGRTFVIKKVGKNEMD